MSRLTIATIVMLGAAKPAAAAVRMTHNHGMTLDGGSPSSIPFTMDGATISGHLLVAYVIHGTAGTSIDLPAGWSQAINETAAAPAMAVFYKISDGTETDVTVNFGGTVAGAGLAVMEYAGVDTSSPLGQTTSNTGTGTTADSGSITTAVAHRFLVAHFGSSSNTTPSTPGNNFVGRQASSIAASLSMAATDRQVLQTGSYSTTATVGNAAWRGQLVEFVPAATSGSSQVIVSGDSGGFQPSTSASRYMQVFGAGTSGWSSGSTSLPHHASPIGLLKNLRVNVSTAPGAGKSWTFYLTFPDVFIPIDTNLRCTISDTNTSCANTTDGIGLDPAGGNMGSDRSLITLKATPSGTPAATYVTWSMVFQGDTANQSALAGMVPSLTTGPQYGGFNGIDGQNTEALSEQVVAAAGTIKNLYVTIVTSPGSGKTRTFTIRKNGSSTGAPTCQITGTSAKTCNDTSTNLTVAAGDRLAIEFTDSGNTPSTSNIRYGVTFLADTEGEWMTLASDDDALSTAATEYHMINGKDYTKSATEASTYQLAQSTMLKKLYVQLTSAPGNGGGWTFTVRKNGTTDTGLTCAVTDPATTCNSTADVAIADGDLLDIAAVPSSSPAPTGSVSPKFSILGFNGAAAARRRVVVTSQ